jgi:putative DNA primase/helicase
MAEALAPYIARASMLRGVQRFLTVLADVGMGKAHPSAIECSHTGGVRSVRVRWREVIHPSWIDCPLLYLDATARLSVAERWLGPITRLADVQAAAPHMRVIQVHDRVFGYSSMIARAGVGSGKAALANQRRVAEVMQVVGRAAGGRGLLVGPKAMILQMRAQGLIPGAWDVANFAALRGVDSFRSVSAAIVVSRQLPPPAEVERMASIIFASDVQTVLDWYSIRAGARLMFDGTGRAAEFECHPDERVEAIRWLICEAEVQQAIGRVRGVRRTADDPVLVFVLNGVDLGQTPIHQLISWEDLLELCGPVSQMAVRGIVPKLWADIAAICAPRWNEADDPGHAAKLWFRRNREEKAKLARVWRTNEILPPWSVEPVQLRPVSLGLSGKHQRRVWLAADITLEAARDALGALKAG